MGFLNLFSKPPPTVLRLPSGSFTVDRDGAIIASTLPQWFPEPLTRQIGRTVITVFRSALEAQLPLSELILHFAALKITARELRGGAIVFLRPLTPERNF
jgi:hypothetical protein